MHRGPTQHVLDPAASILNTCSKERLIESIFFPRETELLELLLLCALDGEDPCYENAGSNGDRYVREGDSSAAEAANFFKGCLVSTEPRSPPQEYWSADGRLAKPSKSGIPTRTTMQLESRVGKLERLAVSLRGVGCTELPYARRPLAHHPPRTWWSGLCRSAYNRAVLTEFECVPPCSVGGLSYPTTD